MPSGGARAGAGKPLGTLASHTIQTQIQRHRLVVLLEDKVDAIFKALADKAERGDVMAAKELFDRAWGKPAQSLTVDTTIDDKRAPVNEKARSIAAQAYAEAIRNGA